MIINALNKYYEILVEDKKSDIPLYGYSRAKVGFALNISLDGELLDVIPLKIEGNNSKKLVPRILTVPEQKIRSSGISPNFMCDNCTYVLAVDNKGKPERSKEAFLAFKELHHKVLNCANGRASKAILSFLDNWKVEQTGQHIALKDSLEEIFEGSNLVFRLDGERGYIHNDLEIKNLWEQYNSNDEADINGQCLITGDIESIAKLHPTIKNVRNAQSSGASIVSFNAKVYESYGKENGYIAPVGKQSAFAYTTVLNHMLANQKQKVQIGDATTVFWAESPEEIYLDIAAELFNPSNNIEGKENKNAYRRDIKIEELVNEVLYRSKTGQQINDFSEKIDASTKFYVLGLSPNASRISIRYFHSDSFGEFIRKNAQHYKDMEIAKVFDNEPSNIPIWKILSETIPPKSSDKESKPLLSGSIMRSILSGGMYPQSLYNAIIQRVKTDVEIRVNYVRASIIKACLLRKARITKNTNHEEVLTVALNEQSKDKPYLLGRLFAILEKAQKDAGNETIRSRYFASAMTTPGAVYPILLRLAQHHILKAEYGFLSDKRIEEVVQDINGFPAHLTLDEQGIFVLGYYHQKPKLWEKQIKENVNLKEEN